MLVVTYNKEQREIYRNSKSLLTDGMTNRWSEFSQFLNISAVNDSLAGELAKLRAEQDEAKFRNFIQADSVKDIRNNFIQQYTYIAARVVDNTTNLPNNFLILDKGISHGVDDRLGVYDDNGIVGIVVSANKYYSKVMSILHRDSKISVQIERNKAFGTLVWENIANPTIMEMKYVSDHLDIRVGDQVETSGFSTHFPEKIPVGKVIEVSEQKDGSGYRKIKVKISNDLNTTRYVYVVKNLLKEAFIDIKEAEVNE
ncbi:MAG: rod shape-determining protein MreC [Bacteroidota bacterium]